MLRPPLSAPRGHDTQQVHAFLEKGRLEAARDGVQGQAARTAGERHHSHRWAEWADSTRFSTTRKRWGYDTAEVDAFQQEIRDTFLGIKQPPLTLDEANDKRFRMARRRGYDVVQVDAFCDEAEQKLAAMRPDL